MGRDSPQFNCKYSDAVGYGEKCLEISNREKPGSFSVAYVHEVIAMALIGQKKIDEANAHLTKAGEQIKKIKGREGLYLINSDIEKLKKQVNKNNLA